MIPGKKDYLIFSGNSNKQLATKICSYLDILLGDAKVTTFADGEIEVEVNENVRKKEIFVFQSTCNPVNNHLMELLILIDAIKRSSASKITAVIPYFGYARQDKKVAPRVPITAKLVADMLQVAGANRIITMDLHANQIQGFFNIPVDNLFAKPIMVKYLREKFLDGNLVVVSPDAGGVERARSFAKQINAGLAIIDKRRAAPNKAKAMNLIGDVAGKITILYDDMVDTAGTLVEGAELLNDKGAIEIYAECTHPVLSRDAIKRIEDSKIIKLFTTDTIPTRVSNSIEVLTVASLIGEAIDRSYNGDSVVSLFNGGN